jgi:predicted proteasome-type protease
MYSDIIEATKNKLEELREEYGECVGILSQYKLPLRENEKVVLMIMESRMRSNIPVINFLGGLSAACLKREGKTMKEVYEEAGIAQAHEYYWKVYQAFRSEFKRLTPLII